MICLFSKIIIFKLRLLTHEKINPQSGRGLGALQELSSYAPFPFFQFFLRNKTVRYIPQSNSCVNLPPGSRPIFIAPA